MAAKHLPARAACADDALCTSDATLYVRVFREDGRRTGCYSEGDDRGRAPSPGVGRGEGGGGRAGSGARDPPSSSDSPSDGSSSNGGCDQPPHHCTCLGEGSGSARCRAPVKREAESS